MGFYFHWPFCLSKCPYCDFNVHVRAEIPHERFEAATLKALQGYALHVPDRVVVSVFFGGGTPSLMRPESVARILSEIRRLWPCANDWEVTLEANPSTVEQEKFSAFAEAGVTRVSLGVQALRDESLAFLGRKHTVKAAVSAIEILTRTVERFSFDLIYARPAQTLAEWDMELGEALALARGHLSLYQLTIERTTPFYFAQAQGQFTMPEEGLAADLYVLTQEKTATGGLPAYEVSNHAAEGHESRHNLIYWHYGDYIGIGPGAHGRITLEGQKYATRDHSAPEIWLGKVEETGGGAHPFEALSAEAQFTEKLMMGLRLREGVVVSEEDRLTYLDPERLKIVEGQGWLTRQGDILRLSREGQLRLNALIPYILKA